MLTQKEIEFNFKAKTNYFIGLMQGIERFAWWKDGAQYVGTTGKTLKQAHKELADEIQGNQICCDAHKDKVSLLLWKTLKEEVPEDSTSLFLYEVVTPEEMYGKQQYCCGRFVTKGFTVSGDDRFFVPLTGIKRYALLTT